MKSIFSTVVVCLLLTGTYAQPPESYYDNTVGESGYQLKTTLYNIIKGHKEKTYGQLWACFDLTDMKGDTLWDMYSFPPLVGKPNPYYYGYQITQCGTYKMEGDCYNREHSFPASWFGATKNNKPKPMYTDLFHIYPTDGYVNSKRSNYPFGYADKTELYASQNGSKLGYSSTNKELGKDIIVFEPIDEYKGDFARTYFYMATRYQDKIASWNTNSLYAGQVLDGTDTTVYQQWYLDLLLGWHKKDPVSQKEVDRNNAVYLIQNNRNPFIDSANFVQRIWGN